MAKYYPECKKCGTAITVELYGPRKTREWKLETWDWACDDCKAKERQEAAEAAAAANAEMELPPLTGSEKQTAWGEQVRAAKMKEVYEGLEKFIGDLQFELGRIEGWKAVQPDDDDYEKAQRRLRVEFRMKIAHIPLAEAEKAAAAGLAAVERQADAGWWIDHRGKSATDILLDSVCALELESTAIDATAPAEPQTPSTLLRPQGELKTEKIVEVALKKATITVYLAERRDDFKTLVKGMDFHWDRMWKREILTVIDDPVERTAEVVHRLLGAGFVVQITADQQQQIIARVEAGDWQPEHPRWVLGSKSGEKFYLRWGRKDDLYDAARKIRGSKWERPNVTIPVEQWQEVLGFAEAHDFRIAPGAQKQVETQRVRLAEAIEIELTEPAARPAGKRATNVPQKLETPVPAVDPELMDD